MRITPWIPPVAWMGVIFWLSTGSFSVEETGGWILPFLQRLFPWATISQLEFLHWLGRKTAHVTEYAILAWLWHRAFVKAGPSTFQKRAGVLSAFGLTVVYAIVDELHQGWTGQRGGSTADVVLDAFGGGAALVLISRGWLRTAEWLTGALLWFAAFGGTLLLLVLALAGASPRWLWGSVPLAWITLWAWTRHRRLDRSDSRE
ncbi:MAG: VanZ family protein [Anaerolineae bacterium]